MQPLTLLIAGREKGTVILLVPKRLALQTFSTYRGGHSLVKSIPSLFPGIPLPQEIRYQFVDEASQTQGSRSTNKAEVGR